MIDINIRGQIEDVSTDTLRKMVNCLNCIYVVKMEEKDGEEEYLVCSFTGPANTVQLPSGYRCINGKWLCRQWSGEEFSPVALLSFDSILTHRLANIETLEIFEPYF